MARLQGYKNESIFWLKLVRLSSGQLVRTQKDGKEIVFIYIYIYILCVCECKVVMSGFYKHKHTHTLEVASLNYTR
jgi:hypothetical protein